MGIQFWVRYFLLVKHFDSYKMRVFTSILFVVFYIVSTTAQQEKPAYLEFSFGRSQHGSGDIPGFHYGFNYGEQFGKRFFWQLGFEGTINDMPDFLLFYELPNGEIVDASLHTVIAGYQLTTGVNYNFIQSTRHELGLALLPLFRYQATSLSDAYDTLFPALTNLPFPVRNIFRFEPGRTFSVGGSVRLQYQFNFSEKYYVGLFGAFQTDTNGDTLPHYSLRIGRTF